MATQDMRNWQTSISKVVSDNGEEEVIVRGHKLSQLIGEVSFAEMIFLMLQGKLPSKAQARVLDALLVASVEHGIAPPSMISRCFASYGTSLQVAVGGGVIAFGDRMGGLGEQLAQLLVERLSKLGANLDDISDDTLDQEAVAVVADARASRQRVPGYGIPLHASDPRTPRVLDVAKEAGTFGPYCRFATRIEAALADQRGGRPVPMNLDGVGACVILDLGFDWRATRLFIITARSISMGAHYLEEQSQDTTWRHLPADEIDYIGALPDKQD
jgi:citrate synthase